MTNQNTHYSYVHRLQRAYARPSQPKVQRYHSVHGHQPFRPLPAPTGAPPYHLALANVLPPEQIQSIT
ncbi:MAG: hypothetical protein JOZ71_02400, partial [Ktedonobacteraceae bacterium]|nr:hypothetical protein [Ktedonobacteraceae bacterium]